MVPSFCQSLRIVRVCRPELNSVSKLVRETIMWFVTFQMHDDENGSLLDRKVFENKSIKVAEQDDKKSGGRVGYYHLPARLKRASTHSGLHLQLLGSFVPACDLFFFS